VLWEATDVSEKHFAYVFSGKEILYEEPRMKKLAMLVSWLACYSTLKME
jgi:hypothetical protein